MAHILQYCVVPFGKNTHIMTIQFARKSLHEEAMKPFLNKLIVISSRLTTIHIHTYQHKAYKKQWPHKRPMHARFSQCLRT